MSTHNSSPAGHLLSERRDTIVMVRWALILACSYMVLFSEGSSGVNGPGGLIIALFLASNLVVGRMRSDFMGSQQFAVGVGVLDSFFIAASLFFAGQIMVELVVLFLGVLILTIAGLRMGVIAGATLAMSGAYVLIAWLIGGESLMRSSMLLRVPFLLCAAIVYAWITEAGDTARGKKSALDVSGMRAALALQQEAIARCQTAVAQLSQPSARAALDEIIVRNRELLAKVTALEPAVAEQHVSAPSMAHSAA